MRALGFKLIAALISFVVGTAAASLRFTSNDFPRAAVSTTSTSPTIDYPPPPFHSSNISRIASMLNQLVEAKATVKTNTFYVEEVDDEALGGKFARVYWKENEGSGCDDPQGYSVEEDPETNSLKIVSGGTVLHTIKLLTDAERNGFAFNGAKKTKAGFEVSIEYGSRIYYGKTFIFICRHRQFYLSKIAVESFDKQNPEKWSRRVIKVRPNVPLEKFSLTDFMLEGVVQH